MRFLTNPLLKNPPNEQERSSGAKVRTHCQGLNGTTEAVPYPKAERKRVFPQLPELTCALATNTCGFYRRAAVLSHHVKGTPQKKLFWAPTSGGKWRIDWPRTNRGA